MTAKDGQKRKRATREEMMARLQAKLERLQAQKEGTYVPDDETLTLKRLRSALRKRHTAMGNARMLLNGRPATEKSPAMNSIDEKIANAEKRLADLHTAKARAEEQLANLPFDIERLEAIIGVAETGTDVEFPTGLYPLPSEQDRTEAEVEASVANSDE